MYVSDYVFMYVYMYICNMYVYMYICNMYVYMYEYMYVCIDIHICTLCMWRKWGCRQMLHISRHMWQDQVSLDMRWVMEMLLYLRIIISKSLTLVIPLIYVWNVWWIVDGWARTPVVQITGHEVGRLIHINPETIKGNEVMEF